MRLLTILFLIGISASLCAQSLLQTNGKAVVNESGDTIILRGMGLGGWMLQEGYMLKTSAFANPQYQIRQKIEELIGTEATDEFYEAWLTNHVTKEDIDSLASWGFNSVRLPMHYNLFTLPIEEEAVAGQQTWLEKGFELTDALIEWCRANEMYVILDLHAAPGGQGMDQGISDYNPEKPSLWESELNQNKTVALWRRIAERYKDEPVIGAYDLINETNWQMNNNQPLKDLSVKITDAIREVDQNHIIIIEGNWFANDFTNMTPPWDDNMMYGPHKYWSFNDQASIQWVIDIRDRYNVPIYFGESGENSNVWFRDAIALIESEGMGWAWWPMKKIDDIAGPLSINRSEEYDVLLDYWTYGGDQPTSEFARETLMQLTEDLKIKNCKFQPDVVDAMFRQVSSDEAIPYRTFDLPRTVYVSDYDMGVIGSAYHDLDVATYHVSTGSYSAWNRGWSYRNDGVDLEPNDDPHSNGYNIGFVGGDEWTQYSINVIEAGSYDINVRAASEKDSGQFHLSAGTADITSIIDVPNTNGWSSFETVTIPDVVLTKEDKKLRFYVDQIEFNVGSFDFIFKEPLAEIESKFLSGTTSDDRTIQLYFNKPLSTSNEINARDFRVTIDGNAVGITDIKIDAQNSRIVTLQIDTEMRSQQVIMASYNGTDLSAIDDTPLATFTNEIIRNQVAIIHSLPGKIEIEDYFNQEGVQLENTSDDGGGKNIGFLDQGDYLDYWVEITEGGLYEAGFRTAAESERGAVNLEIINPDGTSSYLLDVSFNSTGGWQTWSTTTSAQLNLPKGRHQIRVNITQPLFNINWMNFNLISTSIEPLEFETFTLFPNPTEDFIAIKGALPNPQKLKISLLNSLGQPIYQTVLSASSALNHRINTTGLSAGIYTLKMEDESGRIRIEQIVKVND